MAVSEETKDFLEQVKKGKPRKFVMLTKGTEIVSLVVFKKGNFTKYIKQAKEEGRGVPHFGVVDGKGIDISFKLARADGFDKAPVKTTVLKAYLEDEAELKCKPLFVIVDVAPVLLDEDDPLVQQFLALQPKAFAACDAHPDRAAEIQALCKQITGELEREEQQAANSIGALETLLAGLAGEGASSSAPTPTTSPEPTGNETPAMPPPVAPTVSRAEVDELLVKLRAEIQVIEKNAAADVTKLNAGLSAIDNFLQSDDNASALKYCKALTAALEKMWTEKSKELAQRVDTLLAMDFSARTGDVDKIRTVWAFAQERGSDGRFGSALTAAKSLAALLVAAESAGAPKESDVIATGIVEARKKLVLSCWQSCMREVQDAIDELRDELEAKSVDNDPGQLADAIQGALNDFFDDLNSAILGVEKARDDNTKPIDAAVKVVDRYIASTPTNPIVVHLADTKSALGLNIDVKGTFVKALNEIRTNLTSA